MLDHSIENSMSIAKCHIPLPLLHDFKFVKEGKENGPAHAVRPDEAIKGGTR